MNLLIKDKSFCVFISVTILCFDFVFYFCDASTGLPANQQDKRTTYTQATNNKNEIIILIDV